MSMMLMVKAMQLKVGNPLRKLVLLKLADNANDKGECWPSYQHIADQCEISRSSVKNHVRDLEETGLLKRVFRKDGVKNKSNLFILTLDGSGNDLGQNMPEGGSADNLGDGAGADRRTSHSSEPIIEPSITSDDVEDDKPAKPKSKYSDQFEQWWLAYPKKVGKGKAWTVWKKDKLDGQFDQLIKKLNDQCAMQYAFTDYKFIPHPSTYLNESRYDDEVQLVTKAPAGGNNAANQPTYTDNSLVGKARAKADASYQAMLDEEARSSR